MKNEKIFVGMAPIENIRQLTYTILFVVHSDLITIQSGWISQDLMHLIMQLGLTKDLKI